MEKKLKDDGRTVVQSYKLTTIRNSFGLYGQRALLRVVESVQSHMKGLSFRDGADIRKVPVVDRGLDGDMVFVLDLKSICPEGVTCFEPMRRDLREMMKLRFEYEDDKVWEAMNVFRKVRVSKGSWTAQLTVCADVWEVLMDFSKGFRRVEIETAMRFRSKYTVRFFQLISGQRGPLVMDVGELKGMFGVADMYASSALFMQKVVQRAKEELDKLSPLTFDYRVLKVKGVGDGRTGRPGISKIVLLPRRVVGDLNRKDGSRDLKRYLGLKGLFGNREWRTLTLKLGFSEREIDNNLTLFVVAMEKFDLGEFLEEIAPFALRAKKTPQGYTVGAVRKKLRTCGLVVGA